MGVRHLTPCVPGQAAAAFDKAVLYKDGCKAKLNFPSEYYAEDMSSLTGETQRSLVEDDSVGSDCMWYGYAPHDHKLITTRMYIHAHTVGGSPSPGSSQLADLELTT